MRLIIMMKKSKTYKKKKILILTNSSGGLYAFRKELIEELKKTNDIIASTPFDGRNNELRELGCQLLETEFERRGLNPFRDFLLMIEYSKLIKREKPDFIITYTIKPNIYGGLMARLNKIPYAVNITGLGTAFEKKGLLRTFVIIMYRLALQKAKVVFFENSTNGNLFLQERIIKLEQEHVLNGAGVNLHKFVLQPYPNNRIFKFLFVGRVMREKGIDELFAAMDRLHKEDQICHLDMVGAFDEDYGNIIKMYENKGWLTYFGPQLDVRPFIAQSDCFVLPSWHEGMANTNLESASSGRPIITSNIPGCREAVIDGITGFLCEPKDVDSLYNIMKKILVINKEEREIMGQAGRKHMENLFDKDKVVQETINILIVKGKCYWIGENN